MGLDVLVLRFRLSSLGMKLPVLAGSVWHGGLGAVLHENNRAAFEQLYGASNESRLYSLLPPEGGAWPAGGVRQFQVSLFGPACQHALAVMQAMVRLGAVGLRPGGQFEVVDIQSLALHQQGAAKPLYTHCGGLLAAPEPTDLAAAWSQTAAGVASCPPENWGVQLLSPLRIKEKNHDLLVAPSCGQLLRRVLGRAEQLAHTAGIVLPWLREGRAEWLQLAASVGTAYTDVAWCEMARRSARTGHAMSFGGLMGRLVYTQVPPPLAAWLLMSQGLQIGGKTAFGFGGVAVQVAQTCNSMKEVT